MQSMMIILVFGTAVGMVLLALNPSPFFGSLNLVLLVLYSCGVLVLYGGSFLSLVLLMIYLGGMLVVFVYSSALSADKDPEMPGSGSFVLGVVGYLLFGFGFWHWSTGPGGFWWSTGGGLDWGVIFRCDMEGASLMYSVGGMVLLVGVLGLLLTLFVVLELVRGHNKGSLRAV